MNNILAYSFLFVFSVLVSSLSQIMLKKSSQKEHPNRLHEYLNPLVISAYAVFFVASFLTMFAYRGVPLSLGPVLESCGYVFIAAFSWLFLKEKIRKKKLLGMCTIIAGIIIFSLG